MCVELPDDVIPGILARLPFSSLVRAGAVCKRWHSLVLCLQGCQSTPWCLLFFPVHLDLEEVEAEWISWMFDPFACKWHKFATPFLGLNPWTEVVLFRSTGGYSGLVGLLQWGTVTGETCQVYWVGNPITNKWLKIPAPSNTAVDHGCIVVDKISKSYRIVGIERQGGSICGWGANIYESRTRRWQSGARFVRPGSVLLPGATAASNNVLYFLIMSHVSWIEIVSYDIGRNQFDVVIPMSEFVHPGVYMNAGTFQLFLNNEFSDAQTERVQFVVGTLEQYFPSNNRKQKLETAQERGDQQEDAHVVGDELLLEREERNEGDVAGTELYQHVSICEPTVAPTRYRVNKICVAKFLDCGKKWILEDQQIDARSWFPTGTSNLFKCTGDTLHFYVATFDCPNVVVMYDGQEKRWSRLPSWSKSGYEQGTLWNTSTFGSFIPRLDVEL